MRDALVIAGLIGVVFVVRHWQARQVAAPVPAPEGTKQAASVFLSGGNSPDAVLGADMGYGPLRSAWG